MLYCHYPIGYQLLNQIIEVPLQNLREYCFSKPFNDGSTSTIIRFPLESISTEPVIFVRPDPSPTNPLADTTPEVLTSSISPSPS